MRRPAKYLLGTCCLLLLTATSAENGWRPRFEYTFTFDGRTVAGVPSLGQQEHTGIHYYGTLRVQRDINDVLLIKNMTYTKFHENLSEGWWSPLNTERDRLRELPLTSSTVAVKLGRHGEIEMIKMKAGLHDWEMNLIQGMVNQLQIDFKALQTSNKSKKNQINTTYKVMENSVFGRCEVLYEVTRVPRSVALARPEWFPSADRCGHLNFFEMFKTRNFTNCEHSAEFHFGLPVSRKCHPGGIACDDFWTRTSLTRISGCGDQKDFRILQSETNSRVVTKLHLHKGTEASVSSYVSMNLMSMQQTTRRFILPEETVEQRELKFRFTHTDEEKDVCAAHKQDENYTVEKTEEEKGNGTSPQTQDTPTDDPKATFTVNFNTTQKIINKERNQWELGLLGLNNPPHQPLIPYSAALGAYDGSSQKTQKFKEMIADIAKDFEMSKVIHEEMSLEKVLAAVRICRTMTLFELKRAVENVVFKMWNSRQQISESKLYRDTLVMCGTNPAFQILKTWIEESKLEGEDASGVLATLPAHLQTPSPDIVRQFYELIRSSAVLRDKQLKITSLLAFSQVLRAACVDKKTRYAYYTDEVFDATCESHQASHYIEWLANMLRSDPSSQRAYIAALGNTGAASALPHLQRIAEDTSISAYLRASAVISMKYQTLRVPEQTSPVLLSLYHDVGQPVAVRTAAVAMLFYTRPHIVLLQRIAVSTWYDPSMDVAAFVRSSLISLANLEDPNFLELSRNAHMVLPLARPVPLGIHTSHNVLWSRVSSDLQQIVMNQLSYEGSLDATNFYYRYTQRLGGLSRVPFQGDVVISNPDHFLTILRELIYPSDDRSQARPAIPDLERSTRWLKEKLKIAQRNLPKFEGDFRVQFGNFVERIFPFDKELPVELARAGRKLMEEMKTGKDFHYQKVDKTQMQTAVVTELGIPINFELTVPWAVRLAGRAKMDVSSRKFELDVDMMYSSHLMSELSFYTAWDETVHMAASHGVSVVRLPPTTIRASVPQSSLMQLVFETSPAEGSSFLFHHSSTPFTSQNSVYDFMTASRRKSSWVIPSSRNTKEWNSAIPYMKVNYKTEGPNPTPNSWFQSAVNVFGHAMMWPSLEASWIGVQLDGLDSIALEFTLGRGAGNNSIMFTDERLNRPMMPPGAKSTQGDLNMTLEPQGANSTEEHLNMTLEQGANSTQEHLNMTSEEGANSTQEDLSMTLEQQDAKSTEEHIPKDSSYWVRNRMHVTSLGQQDITSDSPGEQFTSAKSSTNPGSANMSPSHVIVVQDTNRSHEFFKAPNIDPFAEEANGSHFGYLLLRVLEGIDHGNAHVLGLDVRVDGTQSKTFSTLWTYAAGRSGRIRRFGVFLKEAEWQGGFTYSLIAATTPVLQLQNAFRANFTPTVQADLVYGTENRTEYRLSLKAEMERSAMAMEDEHLREKCKEQTEERGTDINRDCIEAAMEAMFMNRYNVTVTYNDKCKSFGPVMTQYFNYLRYWFLPYVTEDIEDTTRRYFPTNWIKGVLEIAPSLETLNAWIRTPSTMTNFSNIPVNRIMMDALRFNPTVSYFRRFKGESSCGHGGSKFFTFDGAAFDYNLTSCWHLLAKDCSGQSRFAILMRSVHNNETEVEVNLDNYQIVHLRPGPDVSVNEKPLRLAEETVVEITDEAGTVLVHVEAAEWPQQLISMNMPAHGLHVIYTGSQTVIMADRRMRGRLCGICGDYDGDTVKEFRKPQDNQALNGQEYASSYALTDSECGSRAS